MNDSLSMDHAVVVRKFLAALVVLRRTALVDSKQTDDAGLVSGMIISIFCKFHFIFWYFSKWWFCLCEFSIGQTQYTYIFCKKNFGFDTFISSQTIIKRQKTNIWKTVLDKFPEQFFWEETFLAHAVYFMYVIFKEFSKYELGIWKFQTYFKVSKIIHCTQIYFNIVWRDINTNIFKSIYKSI